MKDGGYEEVFGLNVVEALACGMPVISMRTWGPEDILVQGKTGMLCNTVDEVADAVRMTMDGSIKFDPDACRAGAEVFSRKMVCKSLEQMLESVKRGSRW
jgi:glycosyltransferase involved in cell wall biosynthesis